jgi:selenocysteine-specific elongation factor
VLDESVAALEDRVLRALARLHEAHPRQSAIPRAKLVAALPDLENKTLVAALLNRLNASGKLIGDSRTYALPGHEARLSQGERKLKLELAEAIKAGGFSPPEVNELSAIAGSRAAVIPELLALLCEEQRTVLISQSLYLDADVESDMRRRVRERLSGGAALTMSELRELLGTTRKYSVPIGEYLDRIGLTRREGDVRRLNAAEPPAASSDDTGDAQ